MDTHYQQMYKNVATMQHSFHDYTHATAYDPTATLIRNEMHALTNDIAAGKSRRTIDNRLHTLQNQLQMTKVLNPSSTQVQPGHMPSQAPILNYNQRNFLNNNFQQMRNSIRQHPNF